jgi:hypothetical protein
MPGRQTQELSNLTYAFPHPLRKVLEVVDGVMMEPSAPVPMRWHSKR